MTLYDVTFLFQILHILLDEKSPTQFRIILWLMLFTDYRLKCSKIIWSTISSRRQVAASLGRPENSLDNKAHEEKIRNNLTVKIPVTVQVDRFQATCSCLCALSNDVCPEKKRTSQRNKQWDLISSEWQGPVVVMLPPPLLKKSFHGRCNSAAYCRLFCGCGLMGITQGSLLFSLVSMLMQNMA